MRMHEKDLLLVLVIFVSLPSMAIALFMANRFLGLVITLVIELIVMFACCD